MAPQLRDEMTAIESGSEVGAQVAPWRRYYRSRNSAYLARIERRPLDAILTVVARIGSVFLGRGIAWRVRPILALYELRGFADGVAQRMGRTIPPRGYV